MRYYLIIVEGAHDIATIERVLRLHKIDSPIRHKAELPDVWKRMIPEKYPFHADDLDRITPVPSFWKNADVSVAIKCAGSDKALFSCLQEVCQGLKMREKEQLEKIMLICDADKKSAEEKRKLLLHNSGTAENFQVYVDENGLSLRLDEIAPDERIKVPLVMYVFPDNEGVGTLEDILLESAEEVYPDLKTHAEEYIHAVDTNKYTVLNDATKQKKATVGCIANVLKPGKANQVAVADGEWISEKSLNCDKVNRLYQAIKEFVDIKESAE